MFYCLSDEQEIKNISTSLELLENRVREVKKIVKIPCCQKLVDYINTVIKDRLIDYEYLFSLKIEAIEELRSCIKSFELFEELPPNIKKISENIRYLLYLINTIS